MSTSKWKITEHVVPAAHTRGFARGSVDAFQDSQIRLSVKQYTPLSNPSPSRGDITLIFAGGIGVSKEAFEPFYDALLTSSEKNGNFRIRSIWSADPWNTTASYALNKDLVGDDPHWLDHSRDLYHLINMFQAEMPPPIIGVGESWGVGHFVMMNAWHPRLLAGILALEPALGPGHPLRDSKTGQERLVSWPSAPKYYPAAMVSRRPDRWKTRAEAEKHLAKSQFYADMDPRARALAMKYDLRKLSDETGTYVTLATPKSVEAQHWGRADPPLDGIPPYPAYEQPTSSSKLITGFYKPEGPMFQEGLRHVTCPVHCVWGDKSHLSTIPDYKESFLRRSGDAEKGVDGKVATLSQAMVTGAGHAVTLHKPDESAEASVDWLAETAKAWIDDYERRRTGRPFQKTLSRQWMERVQNLEGLSRPGLSNL